MQLISAPSKTRGRWKRQAGHAEHPLHLWCHACCPLIQVPRAGSSLPQTALPLPDIPSSLRQPPPPQTFLPLSDTLPSLIRSSLSWTFVPFSDSLPFLRQSSLSDILPSLIHSHSSQNSLPSLRHSNFSQASLLLSDIFPPFRHYSSPQTVWLISDCLPSHIHSSFSHSFHPLAYSLSSLRQYSISHIVSLPSAFFLLSCSLTYLRYSSVSLPPHLTNRDI